MEPQKDENQTQAQDNLSRINDPTTPDYYDKDLVEENLELLKIITNLRDLPIILNHRLMVEKEISLLLGNNILIAKPYFNKIKWEKLKKYKEAINEFKPIEFSDLNIKESTIMEIESFINNNQPKTINLSKSNKSFNSSNTNKPDDTNSNNNQEQNSSNNQQNKKGASSKSNKGKMVKYDNDDSNDTSDDIIWEKEVEKEYSQFIRINWQEPLNYSAKKNSA